MKKMRFALSFILCIILAIICAFPTYAASYDLSDLGMSIDIPDSMIVIKGTEMTGNDTCYLQATSQDKTLKISIYMEPASEIQTFEGLSNSALNDIKYQIEAEGFSAGSTENYGNVPFLNFSRQEEDANEMVTTTRLSMTVIDSKKIQIISAVNNYTFSNEELSTITGILNSIEFDSVVQKAKEEKANSIKKWVITILIICVVAALSVYIYIQMKKHKIRKALTTPQKKSTDYDVLSQAEEKNTYSQVGGYKTSSDYFDKAFDENNQKKSATPSPEEKNIPEAQNNKPTAIKRMGYFAKNLKREIDKTKSRSKSKKSPAKTKRKAVDYDIFNEK